MIEVASLSEAILRNHGVTIASGRQKFSRGFCRCESDATSSAAGGIVAVESYRAGVWSINLYR